MTTHQTKLCLGLYLELELLSLLLFLQAAVIAGLLHSERERIYCVEFDFPSGL